MTLENSIWLCGCEVD